MKTYQTLLSSAGSTLRRAEVQPILSDSTDEDWNRRKKAKCVLDETEVFFQKRSETSVGFPSNLDLDVEALEGLNRYNVNNAGDPFTESAYGINALPMEVGVLDWFANLWEIKRDDYWGYITSGGTEGNLYGILLGREQFPEGILYASSESHYSIPKATRLYRMTCEMIPTLVTGEMDYEELHKALLKNSALPAIVNVNIGTSVKGAVDDLDRILEVLNKAGYTHDRFYIHCDGALAGIMIPFLEDASQRLLTFNKPIGSISVSGHKFLGCPFPCGVVISRLQYSKAVSTDIEYISTRDATILGSRNGQAAICLWYALSIKGHDGLRKEVKKCRENAMKLKSMLECARIPVTLNSLSTTVVFERPRDAEFSKKWQLSCCGNDAHVVVMPHVSVEKLETFAMELVDSFSLSFKQEIQKVSSNFSHEE